MKNEIYTRHAHRRAALQFLGRTLREKFIQTDSSPRESLICEEATYADRFISQEAFMDVLEALEQMEEGELKEMQRFELRERDVPVLKMQPLSREERKNVKDSLSEQEKAAGGFKPRPRFTPKGQAGTPPGETPPSGGTGSGTG